jgi:hypothetical protein
MRIEEEGGKVINWNGARVFGVLAMSRAIGFLLSLFLLFLNLLFSNSQILSSIRSLIKASNYVCSHQYHYANAI